LPSNEEILEEMTGFDRPWDDLHHRSYFLLELRRVEAKVAREVVGGPRGPIVIIVEVIQCKVD
jgi:hypothetical protein